MHILAVQARGQQVCLFTGPSVHTPSASMIYATPALSGWLGRRRVVHHPRHKGRPNISVNALRKISVRE